MQARLSGTIRRILPAASSCKLSFAFVAFSSSSSSSSFLPSPSSLLPRSAPSQAQAPAQAPAPAAALPPPSPSQSTPPSPLPLLPSSSSTAAQAPALPGLWAVERLGKGRWWSKHDRAEGRITGYLYNPLAEEEHILVVLDKYQILCLWSNLGVENFMRTVFTMEVYDGLGSTKVLYQERVLPRRVNFDRHGAICNVGFIRAPPGVKLHLDVGVLVTGHENCIGMKKGGRLKCYKRYVRLYCLPEELPPYVEVKIDNLDIGDKILVADIGNELPLHPMSEPSSVLLEIKENWEGPIFR